MNKPTNDNECVEPLKEYRKMMNQKDGSRKVEVFPIPDGLLSEKPTLLLCSECKKQGVRTKIWKNDELYICLQVDCSVRYYWDGGIYYV